MSAPLLSLELVSRCRTVLLKCREFDSSAHLRTLFLSDELRSYRDQIPDAGDREARVDSVMDVLTLRHLKDGRSVFGLFLAALRENQPPDDAVVAEIDLLLESLHTYADEDGAADFRLRFANRDYEKALIRQLLEIGGPVQITASGGLGKTFLLREVERLLRREGWQTIWIDFSDPRFGSSRANEEKFLHSFAEQLPELNQEVLAGRSLEDMLRLLGRHITSRGLGRVLLIVDNADRGYSKLLGWIRGTFLPVLQDWGKVQILAAGQRMVPEWEGHRDGRPFQRIHLSEFLDQQLIRQIVDDVVVRYGAPRIKERRRGDPALWNQTLQLLTEDLLDVSLGHPLAIELCLRYAAADGMLNQHIFRQDLDLIRLKCLRPVVRERVLLNLHPPVQEAFVAICTFRYCWPSLLRTLGSGSATLWAPFAASGRGWEYWWMALQDTHLIEDADNARLMHPVMPLIRRIVAVVQATEDPEIYRGRHEVAFHEFNRLLGQTAPSSRRAAWLIELIFHTTQCALLSPTEASQFFHARLQEVLGEAQANEADEYPDLLMRLRDWLRKDTELSVAVAAFAGPAAFAVLETCVADALEAWRAGSDG
jgi:hypothetical protein